MTTDFDLELDRRNTDSMKWERYADPDVIPMWVADMDFATPPAVLAALRARLDHGILGYAIPGPGLVAAVRSHLQREYAWEVASEWLVWLPGVVSGLNVACRAYAEGGAVATHTPVYPPFLTAPQYAGLGTAVVPLAVRRGRYELDLASLRRQTPRECRLLLLCNPENPGGSLHGPAELAELLAFAEERDLVVCSDEIHCGLVLEEGMRHTPFAALNARAAARSVVLMAPSKTYNVPGLSCAFAVIPDVRLRARFEATMRGIVPHVNALGLVGCEVAYRDCDDWRLELIRYLRANRDLLEGRIAGMPGLSVAHPEATYLAWIDCRQTGLADPAGFFERHGVGLADGGIYGSPGFVRLNFACPRARLLRALDRMAAALGR